MPYTKKDYPNSLKNLPTQVRNKAIDILNSLLEEKAMQENMAIPTVISRAKDWAVNRGIDISESETDSKQHGNDLYIVPKENEWSIKKEKADRASFVFENKKDAIDKAFEMAKQMRVSVTIYGTDGKIETKRSFV